MAFYLDSTIRPASQKGAFVDYLDPAAVDAFISLSYQKHFDHIGEFFGRRSSSHSGTSRPCIPLTAHVDGVFQPGFEKKYGYSPMKYYPALWYDIGPNTAAARNALFGYRAYLFATSFVKRVEDFCEAHGIKAGGHFDQEEIVNPVAVNGDFIKVFEYEGVPAVDDIYFLGRSNPGTRSRRRRHSTGTSR